MPFSRRCTICVTWNTETAKNRLKIKFLSLDFETE